MMGRESDISLQAGRIIWIINAQPVYLLPLFPSLSLTHMLQSNPLPAQKGLPLKYNARTGIF